MTKLIIGDRGTGRTTDLIRASADDEAHGVVSYIVCHNQEECYRISKLAQEMELHIGFPITYEEFLHGKYSGTNIDKFYIDNLHRLLARMCPIEIDTVVW